MKPTTDTYAELDNAYRYFNDKLFGGELPNCLLTLQRRKKAYGYFWGASWKAVKGKKVVDGAVHTVTDEIALNPDTFISRSATEIFSTLVHEQCHLWQQHFGKPSRNGYHNQQWVDKMESVGLIASNTGLPGGKQTGQQMTHYIAPEGAFATVCAELVKSGGCIPWVSLTNLGDVKTKAEKKASKTKYTCPSCGLNVWGKLGIKVMCGEDDEMLIADEEGEGEGSED